MRPFRKRLIAGELFGVDMGVHGEPCSERLLPNEPSGERQRQRQRETNGEMVVSGNVSKRRIPSNGGLVLGEPCDQRLLQYIAGEPCDQRLLQYIAGEPCDQRLLQYIAGQPCDQRLVPVALGE